MFKFAVAACAAVSVTAQMQNVVDLLIMDELAHRDGPHGGRDNGLRNLLLLQGLSGFPSQTGGSMMFEEWMLWDSMTSGDHSHGHHGRDEVLPLMLLGMAEGKSTFDAMMAIHEYDIAMSYDDEFAGGRGLLGALSLADPVLNKNLHNLHVIQGVQRDRHNNMGADLIPLAFLTTNDPDVQMENLHQYHLMQNFHKDHNNLIPMALLSGGGLFNTVEPIAPFWAMDQLLNGHRYNGEHRGQGHGDHGDHHTAGYYSAGHHRGYGRRVGYRGHH